MNHWIKSTKSLNLFWFCFLTDLIAAMRLKKTSNGVRNNKNIRYLQTRLSSLSCHFQQPWISSSRFWAPTSFHPTPHLSFESVPHLTGILSSTLGTTDWSDHIPPFDWKPQLLVLSPDSTLETSGFSLKFPWFFGILPRFHIRNYC